VKRRRCRAVARAGRGASGHWQPSISALPRRLPNPLMVVIVTHDMGCYRRRRSPLIAPAARRRVPSDDGNARHHSLRAAHRQRLSHAIAGSDYHNPLVVIGSDHHVTTVQEESPWQPWVLTCPGEVHMNIYKYINIHNYIIIHVCRSLPAAGLARINRRGGRGCLRPGRQPRPTPYARHAAMAAWPMAEARHAICMGVARVAARVEASVAAWPTCTVAILGARHQQGQLGLHRPRPAEKPLETPPAAQRVRACG
jgi:hypothetical protein